MERAWREHGGVSEWEKRLQWCGYRSVLRVMMFGCLIAVLVPPMWHPPTSGGSRTCMRPRCCRRGHGNWRSGTHTGAARPYYFRRLDQRIELEFGVADRLMTAFYLNYEWKAGDANGAEPGGGLVTEQGASISNEWKYKIADRVADPLGVALYGEFTLGLHERELEFKVILDKQLGRFLLAGNLVASRSGRMNSRMGCWQTGERIEARRQRRDLVQHVRPVLIRTRGGGAERP